MAAHSEASMPASQAASSRESPHCWRLCWMALAKTPAQKRRRMVKFAEGAIRMLSVLILIYPHFLYSSTQYSEWVAMSSPRRPHKFDYLSEYGAGDPSTKASGQATPLPASSPAPISPTTQT